MHPTPKIFSKGKVYCARGWDHADRPAQSSNSDLHLASGASVSQVINISIRYH